MKIAVYAIALNEAQFVERWAASAAEADILLIADTGSTDETRELALENGVCVIDAFVSPWRFDMARNAALSAIPLDVDYCIALDLDEILLPGWREALEPALRNGVTRPQYQYTWSWNDDGSPGLVYGGDKIHARKGYRWKHPVHEVLTRYGDEPETREWTSLEIHHYPDHSKSRGQYFPLLRQAVQEDPYDDRNAHYFARELYFNGMFDEATAEFQRHLSLERAVWPPERAASMRYLSKMSADPETREKWLWMAVNESPGRREPLVDLAAHYYVLGQWEMSLEAAEDALAITEKPLEYLCEAEAWGSAPYDYAAIAAANLGLLEKAVEYSRRAVELNPADPRLHQNHQLCLEALQSPAETDDTQES